MKFAQLAVLLLAGSWITVTQAEQSAEEYTVKGAFVLNFAKFVEWPAQAFKTPADPITICVMGTHALNPAMDAAARQLTVGTHPVVTKQIQEAQQAHPCHILFVSASERKRVRAVLEAVQMENVLTVGESEGFLAGGGIIEFKVEDSRVRMEISEAAAKRAGLHISAKLLTLAQAGKR